MATKVAIDKKADKGCRCKGKDFKETERHIWQTRMMKDGIVHHQDVSI